MRSIGLDVHRDFCEVAIIEDGIIRSAPRVRTTPEDLLGFAQSLSPTTGSASNYVQGGSPCTQHVSPSGLWCIAVSSVIPPTSGGCSRQVDVQTSSNACAGVFAVSGTGNASGDGTCSAPVSCVTVSGTGNATNTSYYRYCGGGCVAVSGTGNATNRSNPCYGAVICVAASGTGNATNRSNPCYGAVICVAASGTGNATNTIYCYGAVSCVAVSA
ncbi:MAG: hypothetical protein ACYDCC_07850, partial [Actinomycetota bacterium]